MRVTELEKKLLNEFQHNFPLSNRPYLDMAQRLNVTENQVIEKLSVLKEKGLISRIGAVFAPNRNGVSTLAAMQVPAENLQRIASIVNEYDEVNHNYEREHDINLWFVLTAADEEQLRWVIQDIEAVTGYAVMPLPMLESYHIDLGFDLKWI